MKILYWQGWFSTTTFGFGEDYWDGVDVKILEYK